MPISYREYKRRPERKWNKSGRPIYTSERWKRLRTWFLNHNPTCAHCIRELANQVDHVTPLRQGGDPWNTANLQALCQKCHSRKTYLETQGKIVPSTLKDALDTVNAIVGGEHQCLIVLCGPSHSGKSTFAQGVEGCLLLNSDDLRQQYGEYVWEQMYQQRTMALTNKQNVLLDALHISTKARAHAIDDKNARRRTIVVFDVSKAEVELRAEETGRVPIDEVRRMWHDFQVCKPSKQELEHEGFDDVLLVR